LSTQTYLDLLCIDVFIAAQFVAPQVGCDNELVVRDEFCFCCFFQRVDVLRLVDLDGTGFVVSIEVEV